jgi:Ras GTPase-activating-like protein IQGAP2/3
VRGCVPVANIPPQTFIFELTDLYDKKNMPKVIYCIHVLR